MEQERQVHIERWRGQDNDYLGRQQRQVQAAICLPLGPGPRRRLEERGMGIEPSLFYDKTCFFYVF